MARPRKTPAGAPAGSAPGGAPEAPKIKKSKQEVLKELAPKRVSNAVRCIRLVGNLGAYKPTETQAQAILKALGDAAQDCKARLAGGIQQASGFSLPE